MRSFNLTCIRPRGFPHSSAFREVMESLSWSLSSLGYHATISENWFSTLPETTNIIFGAELLAPNQPAAIPPGTILYNLEQPSHPYMEKVKAIAIGSRCQVWDYSLRNVAMWRELGADVRHVPIGYTPNLTRIPKAQVQDIDVLFFGCMTPRRNKIIEELTTAGLKVYASDNCYGGGRDNLISRAKVCLNIHHDGREMFEIVRVSYLLANSKCVVTEVSSDWEEYRDLTGGLWTSVYDKIVEDCVYLSKVETIDIQHMGRSLFSRHDYTSTVAGALSELSPQQKVAQRYQAGCAQGDMKDFMPWLRDHAKGTCLEIGVRDGASTSALLSGVERNGGVVISIDVAECGELFKGHPQWKFVRCSSQDLKLHLADIDVLLIDGDHTREGYRADLERFYPLVKPGGLILSHDIAVDPSLTMEATGQTDRPSKYIRDEYFSFCAMRGLDHEELPGFAGMGVMHKPLAPKPWINDPVDSGESRQALLK